MFREDLVVVGWCPSFLAPGKHPAHDRVVESAHGSAPGARSDEAAAPPRRGRIVEATAKQASQRLCDELLGVHRTVQDQCVERPQLARDAHDVWQWLSTWLTKNTRGRAGSAWRPQAGPFGNSSLRFWP